MSISTEVTTPLQFNGVTKLAEKRVKSGVCHILVIAAPGRLMQGEITCSENWGVVYATRQVPGQP